MDPKLCSWTLEEVLNAMKVKAKLFATLRDGREKEMDIDRDETFTVREILDTLDIRQEEVAILLINGRDGSFETLLSDGDTVSLFPAVGGG
jgi:molybdopterin synthase sulfur carrier subunit